MAATDLWNSGPFLGPASAPVWPSSQPNMAFPTVHSQPALHRPIPQAPQAPQPPQASQAPQFSQTAPNQGFVYLPNQPQRPISSSPQPPPPPYQNNPKPTVHFTPPLSAATPNVHPPQHSFSSPIPTPSQFPAPPPPPPPPPPTPPQHYAPPASNTTRYYAQHQPQRPFQGTNTAPMPVPVPNQRPYVNNNQHYNQPNAYPSDSSLDGYSSDPERYYRRRRHRQGRGHGHDYSDDDDSYDKTARRRFKSDATRSTAFSNTHAFIGAAGGGLIGDLIFPGLGTVGGALAGWLGGKDYSQRRREREDRLAREQEEWERKFRHRDHHRHRHRSHSRTRHG